MSKRSRLLWTTAVVCSVPVLLVGGWFAQRALFGGEQYVPDQEEEGITRALDRSSSGGLSGLVFTDATSEAGIDFDHFPFERTSQIPEDMGSGLAWGDYDADGYPDLFLVNFAAPVGASDAELAASAATDRLYRNLGDGTFEDVTNRSGVGRAHRGMGAAWADFDADGDLDLFVTGWGEPVLWSNRGDGTFEDVTVPAGLSGSGFWAGASWADFDLDGDLDVYVTGYVKYQAESGDVASRREQGEFPFTLNPSSYAAEPNRLFVNRGDGTFAERGLEAGVRGGEGKSLAAAWVDLDQDGWLDLYVANDVSDNLLFRNSGDGTFEDVSYAALVADYRGAMGIGVGDWDGDLDQDMFITHWIAQENALYTNTLSDLAASGVQGLMNFGDDSDRLGLGQISLDLIGWATSFADFNNDGWLDLYVVNGSTLQQRADPSRLVTMDPHLYWNRGGTEGFFEVGEDAGFRVTPQSVGRGGAVADYDRDGDLDVAILNLGGTVRLLRNDSRARHWVGFDVVASSGHPGALGARVITYAGDQAFLREVGASPSYLSMDERTVHVGLGDRSVVDSVSVTWTSGEPETWYDLEADRRWRLEQGSEPRRIGSTGPEDRARVATLDTDMSREQTQRFWQLDREAGRAYNRGDWAAAVDPLTDMLALDPDHLDARYDLGNAYLELRRYEDAIDAWKQLIESNPASVRAWVQMGVVYTQLDAGRVFSLDDAVDAFESAHDLNRDQSGPIMLWGEAELARGDTETAAGLLESAYQMNDRAASALYLSGYLAWKRGESTEAGRLLDAAKAAQGDLSDVAGSSGEGDTRSSFLAESQRAAERRRVFGACLDALHDEASPLDPDRVFQCVDEVRASLRAAASR